MKKTPEDESQAIIVLQDIEGKLSKYVSMPQEFDLSDAFKAKIMKTHYDMGVDPSLRVQ